MLLLRGLVREHALKLFGQPTDGAVNPLIRIKISGWDVSRGGRRNIVDKVGSSRSLKVG